MTKTYDVKLTKDEIRVLVDACSVTRDHLVCVKGRWTCDGCKKKKDCDLLSELELSLQERVSE